MLDIYNYINSRDVAKHCREINKVWTPFEMAVLISRSNRPISEKHLAWCWLMNEYPDMPTPANFHFKSYESFHEKLVELIDYEEQTLALFMKSEPGVFYTYKGWCNGESYRHGESVYTTYDKAWAAVREDWERGEAYEIVISKIFPDDMGRIDAHADYDGNIYSIYPLCDEQTRREWYTYFDAAKPLEDLTNSIGLFNSQYIDIPVPFKRGDILTASLNPLRDNKKNIFVLDCLDRDDPVSFARHLDYGDDTDMAGWGFFVNENGILYGDHIWYYDRFVYFNGKLEGKDALLHYVNLFFYDKIRLPELLTMQCRILLEEQIENNLRIDTHGCYIIEELCAENRSAYEEDR